MKLLGRNMKFWLTQTGKLTLSMLIGFLFTIFVLMMGIERKSFMEIVTQSLPSYMIVMLMVENLTIVFGGVENHFPLCVSMGSDRKSGFVAMIFSQHLFMLIMFIIAVLPAFFSWFEGEWRLWFILMFCPLLAISLLIMGVSMLSSAAMLKFGKGVGMALYGVILALLVVLGILLVISTPDGVGIGADLRNAVVKMFPFVAWTPLITGLFDALMTGFLYRYIRKSDLRFA